jgi:hypothetical protein
VKLILEILRRGTRDLTDEFYFQLVKQTINNKAIKSVRALWKLMAIIASILPSTDDASPYLLAYIATNTLSSDPLLANPATFVLLRFLTRHYIGEPLNYLPANPTYPESVPGEMQKARLCFGVSLYECLYYQRTTHPKLPIPYVLYYIIAELHAKGSARTRGFLRLRHDEDGLRQILSKVNEDVRVISNGDVHVVGAAFKTWLRELANPIVPIELSDTFVEMSECNKFREFADKLPTLHRLTLFYIIGYLRELADSAERLGLDKSDIATQFGPLLVNPVRISKRRPELVQNLTELAVAFCSRLIDYRDLNPIYPLKKEFLDEPEDESVPTRDADIQPKPKPKAAPPPVDDSEEESEQAVAIRDADYYQDG